MPLYYIGNEGCYHIKHDFISIDREKITLSLCKASSESAKGFWIICYKVSRQTIRATGHNRALSGLAR